MPEPERVVLLDDCGRPVGTALRSDVHGHDTVEAVRRRARDVAERAWVRPEDLRAAVETAPFAFSPWLATQLQELPQLMTGTRPPR